jgi:hypothetical protein
MSDVKQTDGFRQREHEQLEAWLKLSYRQRLDWLWQAKLFADRARLSAEARHAEKQTIPNAHSSEPTPAVLKPITDLDAAPPGHGCQYHPRR